MTASPCNRLCPVCGESNQCEMASNHAPVDLPCEEGECWCHAVTISKDRLASIPHAARGQVCLCPACAASPPVLPTP